MAVPVPKLDLDSPTSASSGQLSRSSGSVLSATSNGLGANNFDGSYTLSMNPSTFAKPAMQNGGWYVPQGETSAKLYWNGSWYDNWGQIPGQGNTNTNNNSGGGSNNNSGYYTGPDGFVYRGSNGMSGYDEYLLAQENARKSNEAEVSRLNTAYDYQASQARNQLSDLETQKNNSLSEIDNYQKNTRNQVETSKQEAQTNADTQINEALKTAEDVKQSNRGVLRALGILSSSAAGEILAKPMNAFDEQRAKIVTSLGDRIKGLNDFLNQKVSEFDIAKTNIVSNFNSLYNNIQNDLRFNERQRADAIKAAGAALQDRIAQIESQKIAYAQAVKNQQLSFAQSIASIQAQQNPGADLNKILGSALKISSNFYSSPTASIYQGNQDKEKRLSSL